MRDIIAPSREGKRERLPNRRLAETFSFKFAKPSVGNRAARSPVGALELIAGGEQ